MRKTDTAFFSGASKLMTRPRPVAPYQSIIVRFTVRIESPVSAASRRYMPSHLRLSLLVVYARS